MLHRACQQTGPSCAAHNDALKPSLLLLLLLFELQPPASILVALANYGMLRSACQQTGPSPATVYIDVLNPFLLLLLFKS
jgi:hypothetical protein